MPRILIVDDNVDAGEALAALLRAAGHAEIRVAHCAQAGLSVADAFLPTLVLMDLGLPDMSAYDVARLLSQHPELPDLRLVAMTNDGAHAGRERARESGFERYLLKPVSVAALERLLTRQVL